MTFDFFGWLLAFFFGFQTDDVAPPTDPPIELDGRSWMDPNS